MPTFTDQLVISGDRALYYLVMESMEGCYLENVDVTYKLPRKQRSRNEYVKK